MLAPTPFQMPVEEDKAESGKEKSGFHPEGISGTASGGIKIPSSEDKSEGEVNVFSPHGKKMAAFEDLEADASKLGKKPSPGSPAPEGVLAAQRLQTGQPSTEV